MTGRTPAILGFAVAYLVTGVVFAVLSVGATLSGLEYALTNWFLIGLWPLYLFFPEDLVIVLMGLVAGLGTLSVLKHSRLPIATPRYVPRLSPRRFGEFTATLLVAEVVARLTSAAVFVGYLHAFGAHRGEPGTSIGATVALYRDAVSFFTAYLDLPALVWVSHLLPEIRSLSSGGPNQNHVLRQIGEIQFFDGIGFALVVGYLVALALSYVGVRLVSAWLLAQTNRIERTDI